MQCQRGIDNRRIVGRFFKPSEQGWEIKRHITTVLRRTRPAVMSKPAESRLEETAIEGASRPPAGSRRQTQQPAGSRQEEPTNTCLIEESPSNGLHMPGFSRHLRLPSDSSGGPDRIKTPLAAGLQPASGALKSGAIQLMNRSVTVI
jgi:hypothetical protein